MLAYHVSRVSLYGLPHLSPSDSSAALVQMFDEPSLKSEAQCNRPYGQGGDVTSVHGKRRLWALCQLHEMELLLGTFVNAKNLWLDRGRSLESYQGYSAHY